MLQDEELRVWDLRVHSVGGGERSILYWSASAEVKCSMAKIF